MIVNYSNYCLVTLKCGTVKSSKCTTHAHDWAGESFEFSVGQIDTSSETVQTYLHNIKTEPLDPDF